MNKMKMLYCFIFIQIGFYQFNFAQDVRLNTGTEMGDSVFPSMDMNTSGAVVACWTNYDFDTYEGQGSIIYVPKNGMSDETPFDLVDPSWGNFQISPDVALNENGHFIVVWDENPEEGDAIYGRMFYKNKSPKADPFLIYESQSGERVGSPRVALSLSGDFAVCWFSLKEGYSREIFLQLFNRDGSAKGDRIQVNDDTTGLQNSPMIAMNSTGNFVIAWIDERNGLPDIYAQRYDENGLAQGDNFEVSQHPDQTENLYQPSLAIQENGDFMITWVYVDEANDWHVYASLFDKEGLPKTSMTVVDNVADTDSHLYPTVISNPQGGYIIAWTRRYYIGDDRYYTVYARDYDETGTAVDDTYRVGEEGVPYQERPCAGIDATGNKIFIWEDSRDGDRANIYATAHPARKPHLVSVGTGFQNMIPVSWSPLYGSDTDIRYKIYRGTETTGPFSLLGEVNSSSRPYPKLMLDYLDETAEAGTDYYYQVEAVTSESGGPSEALLGTASNRGYQLDSRWMQQQPVLDGIIQDNEWLEAVKTDISNPNAYYPVWLYIKNSQDTLYIAVKDENDNKMELFNCLGFMLDANHNQKWDTDPKEGAFRIYNSALAFTAYTGTYPATFHSGVPVISTDIRGSVTLTDNQLHYEAAIPLTDGLLTAVPGDTLWIAFWVEDPGSDYGLLYGNAAEWPPNALWEATETLGRVILAEEPPVPSDSTQMYNWTMNSKSREQNSWAQYEAWLKPPFEYEYTYGDFWASGLAFYNDKLYTTTFDMIEENPAFIYAYDFETGNQVWQFEMPGAEGDAVLTPAVNDSLIFCASYSVNGLYALDRNTGSQEWHADIPAFTPVLDDNRLYLFTDSLYCLDIQDGSVNWSEETWNIEYGIPALDDSSCFYSRSRFTYCHDKMTGENIWGIQNWGLDCIALDENYIYTSSRDSIIAVDKSNGEIVWRYPTGEYGLSHEYNNKNAMAVSDHYLCFTIWKDLYPDSYEGISVVNKESGTLVWSKQYSQRRVFTPTIANGVVYFVTRDFILEKSNLYAYELSTGDSLWSDSSADYFFQPIVAHHSLFVATMHGVKAFSNLPLAGIDPKPAHSQPDNFKLFQNYPNPFNPVTTISYQLPKTSQVKLSIYNIQGRLVEILVDGISSAGIHSVEWNAEKVGSGIYFYQLETEGYSWVKKLVVMK